MLAAHLREGARVWQAGMSDAAWTTDQYLMAELIDQAQAANWIASNNGVEKSKQSKMPERIKRPADTRADRIKREREAVEARKNINRAAELERKRRL